MRHGKLRHLGGGYGWIHWFSWKSRGQFEMARAGGWINTWGRRRCARCLFRTNAGGDERVSRSLKHLLDISLGGHHASDCRGSLGRMLAERVPEDTIGRMPHRRHVGIGDWSDGVFTSPWTSDTVGKTIQRLSRMGRKPNSRHAGDEPKRFHFDTRAGRQIPFQASEETRFGTDNGCLAIQSKRIERKKPWRAIEKLHHSSCGVGLKENRLELDEGMEFEDSSE